MRSPAFYPNVGKNMVSPPVAAENLDKSNKLHSNVGGVEMRSYRPDLFDGLSSIQCRDEPREGLKLQACDI